MRRVYLFDIDATLVRTGGVGGRSLGAAFEATFGVADGMRGVRLHGRTDLAILKEMFHRAQRGDEATRENIDQVIDDYLPRLQSAVALTPDYEVLPGVPALLQALRDAGHLLGLATGNVQRGAQIKLLRGGLAGYFSFGGFGDDAEDRGEMVRAARARAQAAHGQPLDAADVFVIGDSELDVQAAHAAGCRSVAVGTGWSSEAELRAAGAEYYFATLEGAADQLPFKR